MTAKTYNILFLCTGNSARSILAEGLITHLSGGRFHGFSAGSHPAGRVNPHALEALKQFGCDTTGFSSKSWDVYAEPGAPHMDFVITVCDSAAGEVCPIWPGQPITAHWGFADPSHVEGDAATRQAAFTRTANAIAHRIRLFLSIPLDKLDRLSLSREIKNLGEA